MLRPIKEKQKKPSISPEKEIRQLFPPKRKTHSDDALARSVRMTPAGFNLRPSFNKGCLMYTTQKLA